MTNFDFLKETSDFDGFSGMAISAELLLHVDADACVICCRRTLETALRWVYSVEPTLSLPARGSLVRMLGDAALYDILGKDLRAPMDLIRIRGNTAAHGASRTGKQQATLVLEALFRFLDRLAYLYAPEYRETPFDPALLELTVEEALSFVSVGRAPTPATGSPSERRASHPLSAAPSRRTGGE